MTRTIQNPDEFVLEDVKMVHYEVMEQREAILDIATELEGK